MKTGFHAKLIAVFTAALAIAMLSLPAFAAEGGASDPAGTQQAGLQAGTLLSKNADSQAKRTILLYDCGADLETDAGLATYNLMQILESSFSSDDDITFLVMTGGSHKWQIDKSKLVFPDGVALPDDAVTNNDADGDGTAFDTAITITDMYGFPIRVSDRVQIKWARIKPAISTGEELEPELVYRGRTLRPGVDYILEKERVWNEETHTREKPDFIEPGDYRVTLYGKGPFMGRNYDTIFSIVRSEEAAQALVDEARSNLKDAQDAFASLDPDDSAATQQLFANLFAAQNALTEAQNELARTRDVLGKEQMAEMEDQIARLEQRIEDLVEQLAEASVVDIGNYEVTMQASFPYVR